MGFLEANPDRQVICDHQNVDWFSEFLIFDWKPDASGPSLQRKKKLVYQIEAVTDGLVVVGIMGQGSGQVGRLPLVYAAY